MVIHEYFYNEENRTLLINFSTDIDCEDFYRILELQIDQIQYFSPTIIDEYDLGYVEEDFIIELLIEYLKENDLPEQQSL
jgi:hypothetical protein